MSRRRPRAAVLVIRMWSEEPNAPVLRARILESQDVTLAESSTSVANTVDGICAVVKAWAERFANADETVRP